MKSVDGCIVGLILTKNLVVGLVAFFFLFFAFVVRKMKTCYYWDDYVRIVGMVNNIWIIDKHGNR
jgi:hypothetical protein